MLHDLFIGAHAAAGVIAFIAGCLALRPPYQGVTTIFRVYLGTLCLMVLFLLAVEGVDWGTLSTDVRLLYVALSALALYTVWRGWRALQDLRHEGGDRSAAYVDNIGFTLIVLFDGFVIVGAIDLGAPVWAVVVIGVLGVLVGRQAISWTKARVPA
jgi:hypothetical protein